jgi:hypothetical protein
MGMDANHGKCALLWGSCNSSGTTQMWSSVVTQSALGVFETPAVNANSPILFPAYPNPSIDFTTFDFEVHETAPLSLVITDINGRIIRTVLANETYSPGRHQVKLNDYELNLSTGFYIATLYTPQGTSSRKFSVIR